MSTTNIRSFGGSVAIGTKDVQGNTLRVDGKVKTKKIKASSLSVGSLTNTHVPIGSIMVWSGAVNALPNHWKLCDGTTYSRTDGTGNITTPDLQDIFVRGGSSNSPTSTTGQHNYIIQADNIPTHNHSANDNNADTLHAHSIPNYASSNHTHGINDMANSNHNHQGSSGSGSHQHNVDQEDHGHNFQNTWNGHTHRCDIVDCRTGRTTGGSGNINYNYNSTAGSNTRMGNVRAYNSYRNPRVDSSGSHQHNASQTGQHDHEGLAAWGNNHQHQNTAQHTHAHSRNTVNQAGHSHNLINAGAHNHQGFNLNASTGMTSNPNSISKLITYYVLAYVIKI